MVSIKRFEGATFTRENDYTYLKCSCSSKTLHQIIYTTTILNHLQARQNTRPNDQ